MEPGKKRPANGSPTDEPKSKRSNAARSPSAAAASTNVAGDYYRPEYNRQSPHVVDSVPTRPKSSTTNRSKSDTTSKPSEATAPLTAMASMAVAHDISPQHEDDQPHNESLTRLLADFEAAIIAKTLPVLKADLVKQRMNEEQAKLEIGKASAYPSSVIEIINGKIAKAEQELNVFLKEQDKCSSDVHAAAITITKSLASSSGNKRRNEELVMIQQQVMNQLQSNTSVIVDVKKDNKALLADMKAIKDGQSSQQRLIDEHSETTGQHAVQLKESLERLKQVQTRVGDLEQYKSIVAKELNRLDELFNSFVNASMNARIEDKGIIYGLKDHVTEIGELLASKTDKNDATVNTSIQDLQKQLQALDACIKEEVLPQTSDIPGLKEQLHGLLTRRNDFDSQINDKIADLQKNSQVSEMRVNGELRPSIYHIDSLKEHLSKLEKSLESKVDKSDTNASAEINDIQRQVQALETRVRDEVLPKITKNQDTGEVQKEAALLQTFFKRIEKLEQAGSNQESIQADKEAAAMQMLRKENQSLSERLKKLEEASKSPEPAQLHEENPAMQALIRENANLREKLKNLEVHNSREETERKLLDEYARLRDRFNKLEAAHHQLETLMRQQPAHRLQSTHSHERLDGRLAEDNTGRLNKLEADQIQIKSRIEQQVAQQLANHTASLPWIESNFRTLHHHLGQINRQYQNLTTEHVAEVIAFSMERRRYPFDSIDKVFNAKIQEVYRKFTDMENQRAEILSKISSLEEHGQEQFDNTGKKLSNLDERTTDIFKALAHNLQDTNQAAVTQNGAISAHLGSTRVDSPLQTSRRKNKLPVFDREKPAKYKRRRDDSDSTNSDGSSELIDSTGSSRPSAHKDRWKMRKHRKGNHSTCCGPW